MQAIEPRVELRSHALAHGANEAEWQLLADEACDGGRAGGRRQGAVGPVHDAKTLLNYTQVHRRQLHVLARVGKIDNRHREAQPLVCVYGDSRVVGCGDAVGGEAHGAGRDVRCAGVARIHEEGDLLRDRGRRSTGDEVDRGDNRPEKSNGNQFAANH